MSLNSFSAILYFTVRGIFWCRFSYAAHHRNDILSKLSLTSFSDNFEEHLNYFYVTLGLKGTHTNNLAFNCRGACLKPDWHLNPSSNWHYAGFITDYSSLWLSRAALNKIWFAIHYCVVKLCRGPKSLRTNVLSEPKHTSYPPLF